MDISKALQNFQNNTASKEEVEFIKRTLSNWEIGIAGDVNHSTIVQGHDNNIQVFQLTPELLNAIDGGKYLGNLERNLTGEEIATGLRRLGKLLQNRAPVLMSEYKDHAERLRSTLKTEEKSLSNTARDERSGSLAAMNRICLEAVDISFNGLCLDEEAPKYDARSPFRGLESFRPEDSEFFFGREALTEKLVAKIKAHSFLAVLGASGSGKSSLVMAGVIPALGLDYAIIRPGENPLEALESAKGKALLVVDQFEELFTLTKNEDKQIRVDFVSAVLDFTRSGKVIITLRSDFLSEVGAYRSLSKEIQNHLETILPMDTDGLRRAMEGQARLTKLEFEADLSQQILEDVDGEPGAMPLLQHALWELWNRRHGRHLRASEYRAFGGVKQAIASTAEQVYGECSKVEQEQLREIFLRLTSLDKNDEGRDTRRRVSLSGLAFSKYNDELTNLLIDKLANARLIVKSVSGDKTEVEVVHEALIRHWERLRIWLNEDRDALRLRESVSESATEWERSGRHESLLNSRWVKLDEALLLVQDSRYPLTEIEQAYLKGCVGLRNREQREREKSLRRTVAASVMAAVIFLILGSFGLVKSNESNINAQEAESNAITAQTNYENALIAQQSAESQKIKAETQYTIARSGELAGQSLLFKEKKYDLALLLGVEANKTYDNTFTRQVLFSNLQADSYLLYYINIFSGTSSFAVSPDEKTIFISKGKWFAMWDLEKKTYELYSLEINDSNNINSITYSKSGEIIALSYVDGVTLWDVDQAKPIGSPLPFTSFEMTFTSDDQMLIFIDNNGFINYWDIEKSTIVKSFEIGSYSKEKISFDGNYFAGIDDNGNVVVWLTDEPRLLYVFTPSDQDQFVSLRFSPDNRNLALVKRKNVDIVDLKSSRGITSTIIFGIDSDLRNVDFYPNGKILAVAYADETIKLWDIENSEALAHLDNKLKKGFYTTSGVDMKFSPHGNFLISLNGDVPVVWSVNTKSAFDNKLVQFLDPIVRLKTINNSNLVLVGTSAGELFLIENTIPGKFTKLPLQYENPVNVIDVANNGHLFVTAGEGEVVTMWETTNYEPVAEFILDYPVSFAVFSPDNKILAISTSDYITFWDVDSRSKIKEISSPKLTKIRTMAFSPNGEIIAAGGIDDTIALWDTHSFSLLSDPIIGTKHAWVTNLEFTQDSQFLFSSYIDWHLSIWNMANVIDEKNRLDLQVGPITGLSLSTDNKIALFGSSLGHLIFWSPETSQQYGENHFIRLDSGVETIDYSLDTDEFITGHSDGTVRFWDVNPESWKLKACQRAGRNFTELEWSTFFPGENYRITCPNLPIEPEATP